MKALRWLPPLVVALAFLARLDFLLHPQQDWDTAWFLNLARSFAEHGSFVVPWTGETNTYWPPLFPLFLAPLVKAFGPSYQTVVGGSILASALLVVAVFFTTRDLMGSERAWAAAALVACCPVFLVSDSLGMSESLVALCATLAAWAFVKSVEKPAWLAPAAVFGALLYLSKATVGLPFFALAVVALAAWRVLARGFRRADALLLGAAALGLVAAFALRGRLGGVGIGLLAPVAEYARDPLFVPLLVAKLALAAAFLLAFCLPFSLGVRKAWRAPRSEATGALWLAVLLVLATGAVFTTTFMMKEGKPFFELDNVRYLAPAIAPMLWLLLPHASFDDARRGGEGWVLAAVASFALLSWLNPIGGVPTNGRLAAFAALSIVPLALAAVAAGKQARLVERKGGAPREERAPAPLWPALPILGVGALAGFLVTPVALVLAVGLCVALASPRPVVRAAVVAIALLGAFTSGISYGFPASEVRDAVAAHARPGDLVTLHEPAVYTAPLMPAGVVVREADAPLPNSTVFVTYAFTNSEPDANWTLVGSFPTDTHFPPGVAARFWIEERVLGMPLDISRYPYVFVYAR